MKIVFVTEFYPANIQADVRGGVELRTWDLSQLLGQQHEVTVIASREAGQPADSRVGQARVLRPGPTSMYHQAGNAWVRVRYVIAARRAVINLRPDVVLLENYLAYLVGLLFPAGLRRRTFLTYHDVWVGQHIQHLGLLNGVAGELIERLTLRTAWRGILANSKYTAENVKKHLRRYTPVHVVYNGVRLADYIALAPEKFTQPTIVTVSRLVKYKRLDDLLYALAEVRKEVPTVQLVIIGSGPMEETWKSLATKLGLSQMVVWRGFVPDHSHVLSAIKGATLFCLPSAVEGYGIVTLEAMACGVPYVSSDIPATQEVTDGGQGGILYPVGDRAALAKGILTILGSSTPRSGVRAPQSLLRRYDWATIVQDCLKIFRAA